jgi:hydroxymethylpyrimidine pyrophosphatase-like HAD family hydrolase
MMAREHSSASASPDLPYRLIALDLDGTLLDHNDRVPAANRDVLLALRARGVEVAFCTGRATSGALVVVDEFPPHFDCALVTFNGVCAYEKGTGGSGSVSVGSGDGVGRKMLHCSPTPVDVAHRVFDFSIAHNLLVEVSDDVMRSLICRSDKNRAFCAEHESILSYSNYRVIHDDSDLRGRSFPLIQVFPPPKRYEAMFEALRAALPDDEAHLIRQVYRGIHWIEVKPARVNKGSGLAALCAHMRIPLDSVVSFGATSTGSALLQPFYSCV